MPFSAGISSVLTQVRPAEQPLLAVLNRITDAATASAVLASLRNPCPGVRELTEEDIEWQLWGTLGPEEALGLKQLEELGVFGIEGALWEQATSKLRELGYAGAHTQQAEQQGGIAAAPGLRCSMLSSLPSCTQQGAISVAAPAPAAPAAHMQQVQQQDEEVAAAPIPLSTQELGPQRGEAAPQQLARGRRERRLPAALVDFVVDPSGNHCSLQQRPPLPSLQGAGFVLDFMPCHLLPGGQAGRGDCVLQSHGVPTCNRSVCSTFQCRARQGTACSCISSS